MNDRAVREADRMLAAALRKIDTLHPDAVALVMRKHKGTLDKLAKLEKEGAWGRARTLVRKSGIVNDLAKAIASAGANAVSVIREEMQGVREVARRDDAEEAAPTGEAG